MQMCIQLTFGTCLKFSTQANKWYKIVLTYILNYSGIKTSDK